MLAQFGSFLNSTLLVLLTVAGIGFLMFVHESGHYLAARWAKMRVIRFSIGAGPVLWQRTSTETGTVFQVALVPFLAYVQIDGMNPLEDNDPGDAALFCNQSVWRRMVVIFAGPFANYACACVLGAIVALAWGIDEPVPNSRDVMVGYVELDGPADRGGMKAGDQLIAIEGAPVTDVMQVRPMTEVRPGQPTRYTVRRDGSERVLTITPARVGTTGRIGIAPDVRRRTRSATAREVLLMATVVPARMSIAMISEVGRALSRRSTENFGGVVQMTRESVRTAEQGARNWLGFLAGLSISLGVLNLLPLPALDGGRMVFLVYELLLRRKANAKLETSMNAVGVVALLGLMIWITFKDIAKQLQ